MGRPTMRLKCTRTSSLIIKILSLLFRHENQPFYQMIPSYFSVISISNILRTMGVMNGKSAVDIKNNLDRKTLCFAIKQHLATNYMLAYLKVKKMRLF